MSTPLFTIARFSAVVIALFAGCRHAAPGATQRPPSPADDEAVRQLIAALGSSDPELRDEAEGAL